MKHGFIVGIALIGIAFAGLSAGAVKAADMNVKAPYSEPIFSWTGCYIGIHGGGGYHVSSFVDVNDVGGIGAVAGAQSGCNYQVSRLVFGLEGEFYWSSLNTQTSNSDPTCCSSQRESKNKYDASVALRLGYAFDRVLAYGKLGVDAGRFEWSSSFDDIICCSEVGSEAGAKTVLGLLLGAGFEYAFTNQLSAKFEYNYLNFGDPVVTFTQTCVGTGCGATTSVFTNTEKEVKHIVKIGLNYKLF